MRSYLLLLSLVFLTLPTHAVDGTAQLKAFIQNSHALTARFKQHSIDQNGRHIQTSTGTLSILRPGKFHWHYDQPFPSEIIGDGKKVWLYDPDLKQVTIKKMQEALESSPAALLAGDNHFEKNYVVHSKGKKEGVTWLEALPKSKDSHFETIRIGLKNAQIQSIHLLDQLGQTTKIDFYQLTLNPILKEQTFTFIPPPGVDIINE